MPYPLSKFFRFISYVEGRTQRTRRRPTEKACPLRKKKITARSNFPSSNRPVSAARRWLIFQPITAFSPISLLSFFNIATVKSLVNASDTESCPCISARTRNSAEEETGSAGGVGPETVRKGTEVLTCQCNPTGVKLLERSWRQFATLCLFT